MLSQTIWIINQFLQVNIVYHLLSTFLMTILKTIMLCLSISLLEALNPAYIRWDVIIYHFFILTTGNRRLASVQKETEQACNWVRSDNQVCHIQIAKLLLRNFVGTRTSRSSTNQKRKKKKKATISDYANIMHEYLKNKKYKFTFDR